MIQVRHPRQRGAFTLVELLVVITILGILFSLTAAAVVRAIAKGDDAKQKNEIAQIATAVEAFKKQFGVSYLPSRFVARNRYLATDEHFAYLRSIWPRIGNDAPPQNNVPQFDVIWPNLLALGNTNAAAELRNVQSLVVFLGGADGTAGFANNPRQPFDTRATGPSTIAPFFEFAPDRLKVSPTNTGQPAGTAAVRDYQDIYNTTYIYFSSRNGNDYEARDEILVQANPLQGLRPFRAPANGVVPGKFINPNGFQLISAGRDQRFGNFQFAQQWNTSNFSVNNNGNWIIWQSGTFTSTDLSTDPKNAAFDNVANFHPTQLGIAAN